MPIEHISDTARWVAIHRAIESERPDALFKDPYARRLAGTSGEEIERGMKWRKGAQVAMAVRSHVMDEIILREVRAGADCVLNLAAGLDARPWRLDVPASLRWVDVDLPDILEYKTGMLAAERPRCRYEAVKLDLRDGAARRALFARVGAEAKRVLVVSEGLLIYLEPDDVASLADDLASVPSFHAWLIDLASPRLLKWMNKSWGKRVEAGNAAFKFAPAEGTAFFLAHGWREGEFRSSGEEAQRLGRDFPMAWLGRVFALFQSAKTKEEWRRFSGFVLLTR
ncbi:MAG TPA: SAM-dependent methyltransferase [Gemmatimonadaceae bacterium]|nr:SAM-dependent methyltransferase [Gemmatimonadaceae bacterium]